MIRPSLLLLLIVLLSGCWALGKETDEPDLASRVVIVVNKSDPDSVWVGEQYAERRNIPEANIVAIDTPREETISRQKYTEKIHNPLLRVLIEKEWVDGIWSDLVDEEGRSRSLSESHNITYLVLCRGIPLRIKNDPEQITAEMKEAVKKEFQFNGASVDSELALLLVGAPTVSFIPNPLFENPDPHPQYLGQVIKVSRLDGPTAADAVAMVDGALEAETLGLRGRGYVDVAGPFPNGVEWLRTAGNLVKNAGYDLTLREESGVFPIASRFDAPAFYFGWYETNLKGPFALEGFRFVPGAIAMHIHSFSAETVRSTTKGWVGPLVARGAAVTMGNVYEPYLALSHQPDLFMKALLEGKNVGDAAAYAVRGYSWHTVLLGDPLYRPFKVSLEMQLAAAMEEEGGELASYVFVREMNRLVAKGKRKEAVELGRQGLTRQPSLALVLKSAKLQAETGERRQALQSLRVFERLRQVPVMEVMIAKEAADLLISLKEEDRAMTVYEAILGDRSLPVELKKPLLEEGIIVAGKLRKNRQLREWRTQLEALKAGTGK